MLLLIIQDILYHRAINGKIRAEFVYISIFRFWLFPFKVSRPRIVIQ